MKCQLKHHEMSTKTNICSPEFNTNKLLNFKTISILLQIHKIINIVVIPPTIEGKKGTNTQSNKQLIFFRVILSFIVTPTRGRKKKALMHKVTNSLFFSI